MSEIRRWLGLIGLPQYVDAFEANDIGMDLLGEIDDQVLKDIGIAGAGHRLRIRKALAGRSSVPVDAPTTAPDAPAPVPERRQLTVMFCDLVGSTALSTKLDPEDLRGIINAYHHCCADVVERSGGFVAKYMGDGVLAYFGYPRANEHDAERAVRAGLALVDAVPRLATAAGSPLRVRVGIATGLVVVGDLTGSGAAQEQAVVGETPNLAARLQALAEPGTVVIAASTRRLTGGLFEYCDLGAVALKGFAGSVPAWQVLGASAADSRFEALRAATTPLVGRDEEMELLMRRWQQAKLGDGQVVLICGEPGIGKSRIAQTLVERISAEPHTRLRFFCSPHHQDSALYPNITQIERAAGFRREDTADERLAKLEAVLAQGTNELSDVVPLIADLLSIPTGDRYPPLGLTPQKRKEKTLYALMAQVEGLSARQPVLMVFEDVHWSDPTSRESLDLLIERMATLRVLAILTFRPEFTPPWIGRPHVSLVALNRLPPRQRAEMILHLTGGKPLPSEIADQIVDRTDGVPLFIEELTKDVVESGIVTVASDQYKAAGPASPLSIPTSLHASLLARLDRLAATREIAQIGAALGRSFSHELISAVAQMPPQQLDDALAQLVNSELIFRRGTPPDAEYTFKHALVQDAAYSTLLRSRRQQIHDRIVAALEGRFPEIAAAQPELMAHHCAEAGLSGKAAGFWLEAGQRSVVRSAVAEAEAQLRRGLDLLPSLPDDADRRQLELDLQIALGRAHMARRGFGSREVGETNARARVLAEQLDRPDYIPPLFYGSWVFHTVRGEHRTALSFAGKLEQLGEDRGDTAVSLMGQALHGATRMFLGEFATTLKLLEQCEGLSHPAHRAVYATQAADDIHSIMLTYRAIVLTILGHVDQGRARMDQALKEAKQLGHTYTFAQVTAYRCWIDWMTDCSHALAQHSAESEALSIEHGFSFWTTVAKSYRGFAQAAVGNPKDGLTLLQHGLSTMRATGAVVSPLFVTMIADTCNRLGWSAESANWLFQAMEIVDATGERMVEAEVHRVWGDLLTGAGNLTDAQQRYERAISVAQHQNAKIYELRAATGLARLWRDEDKRKAARDLLAPVYGWFTEGLDTPVLKRAKALLEQLG